MSLSSWLPNIAWISLLLFSRHIAAEVAQCYYPNGNLTTDSSVFVCDPRAKFSSCCYTGDMCTTNGFCKDVQNDANNNFYYRDLCTDSTWTSPKCPSFCDTMRTAGEYEACIPQYCAQIFDEERNRSKRIVREPKSSSLFADYVLLRVPEQRYEELL